MATHDVQWYRVRKVLHCYPRERRPIRLIPVSLWEGSRLSPSSLSQFLRPGIKNRLREAII